VAENNESTLIVLDRKSGQELLRFPNEDKGFISMPRWSEDGRFIVALLVSAEGKTIIQADVANGAIKKLLPFAFENYGNPIPHGDVVLFNWDYNGIDNIYALSLINGEKFQVTSRPFGAFSPMIDAKRNRLYFNDYAARGMRVAYTTYQPDRWKPLDEVKNVQSDCLISWKAQEKDTTLHKHVEDIDYKLDKYNSFNHLLNIHSWGLLWRESLL